MGFPVTYRRDVNALFESFCRRRPFSVDGFATRDFSINFPALIAGMVQSGLVDGSGFGAQQWNSLGFVNIKQAKRWLKDISKRPGVYLYSNNNFQGSGNGLLPSVENVHGNSVSQRLATLDLAQGSVLFSYVDWVNFLMGFGARSRTDNLFYFIDGANEAPRRVEMLVRADRTWYTTLSRFNIDVMAFMGLQDGRVEYVLQFYLPDGSGIVNIFNFLGEGGLVDIFDKLEDRLVYARFPQQVTLLNRPIIHDWLFDLKSFQELKGSISQIIQVANNGVTHAINGLSDMKTGADSIYALFARPYFRLGLNYLGQVTSFDFVVSR